MRKLLPLLIVFIMAISAASMFAAKQSTSAVTAADWQAGNIISDLMFTNTNDMSVNDIQSFLNSRVGSCDTNGSLPATEYGRPDLTHAQYATSVRGWPGPPYVCLKDYYEVPKLTPSASIPANNFSGSIPAGALSAAQIIYNAAQRYNLNPKVILVKIATESKGPLTSDTWPMQSQYTYAMGSHCPDSGPGGSANCDTNYAGFSMQVESGAALMRWYLDSMTQSWWTYKKPFQTNSILWNVVERGCGSSDVYISTMATAALYTYTPYQPNAAALNNMYGTGDDCSAYGNRNFWRVWNDLFGSTQTEPTVFTFKSHLSGLGWTSESKNRGITGTTGQGRAMESFRVNGDVSYSSYSYTTGWQPTVSNGMISGTTSISRPIQALKINLGSSLSTKYDIWYRSHVGNVGWMGWVKNGEASGVAGNASNSIEAFEVRLLPKGSYAPGTTTDAFRDTSTTPPSQPVSLSSTAHIGNVGWSPTLSSDMVIGVSEQSKRLEAVTLNLTNTTGLSGSITYSSHVATIGWQPFVTNNALSGTTGKGLQMEAIRIALTEDLGNNYDVWYRGFIKYKGWQGWAKNGDPAGSIGAGLQLEAIEVHILPKTANKFATSQNALYNPSSIASPNLVSLSYSVNASGIGWITNISQNAIGGTVGKSKSLEAIKIDSLSSVLGSGDISCSAYVRGSGWTTPTTGNATCGTTGQSKPIDAIKLTLTGSLSAKYNLSYQTHIAYQGWGSWVSNGVVSGTPDSGRAIEALTVKLVPKS